MECIEGESLAQRITKGALPTEQALKLGTEIADALVKATLPRSRHSRKRAHAYLHDKPLTPRTLDHIVRRCLAKDPDDRWQSAVTLLWNLKPYLQSTPRHIF